MGKKIILVHGLGGTSERTWGRFPDFLKLDQDIDSTIISYGYDSPNLITQVLKRAPSILNIADGLFTDLKTQCDLENDEIILAGHSLGGLIVKKLLLRMKDKQIKHNIKKVCFFDVPHDGSGYANVGQYIAFRNRHLKSLCRDSSELDELNDRWVDSGLDNAFDIISIIAANDDIVSSSSSKSIFRYHRVETINRVNHKTIVKPDSPESPVYVVFKRFILERSTINRFKNNASRDLNDWKRIERNHNFEFVSDEHRDNDLESLIESLGLDKCIVRLSGASGLGKTRLLLEAIERSTLIDESCVLVFDAPGYEKDIRESVRSCVESNVHGLAVIENCSVDLHNDLAKEIHKMDNLLKVVTVAYSHDQVDDSIHIKLSPLSDDAIINVLSPILVGLAHSDVDRVARFAQGYPLMATLIAEQYQKEGRLLGLISNNSVVRKLIEGDEGVSSEEKEVLSACSLFDVFGTTEGTAREEAKFIAENVAGSSLKTFDRVLVNFHKRQVINRAGRYARVVPKPLAITLASIWWQETSCDRQKKLIDDLPDTLMQSFCIQAAYLDSQPDVQRFSERLFGGESPFVLAEELLTERGSRLFRAFVEVNPETTSSALYNCLNGLTHNELVEISGDTRRNLVWGLEKLCFRASVFEKSAWCMLLLASAENETWSNNSTGLFAQLFRVHLSGTEAGPTLRFDLLQKALDLKQEIIDMVVLEALGHAIDTYGGTRTIGAEYQGTKAPLEEWRPVLWQDIFDYWQGAFNLLLRIIDRGEIQKEKILAEVGGSIRGFIGYGRVEMLDSAIRNIISVNGRYWPAALDSIKCTIEYDSEGLKQDAIDALNIWLELLKPNENDLAEKLKILVVNPPWEHRQGDDEFIDVAAQNAKSLAVEVVLELEALMPHLCLILEGDQKQAYAFGYQLSQSLECVKELIEKSFQQLLLIERKNPNFILGIFRGLYDKSPQKWQENIDSILANKELVFLYPDFICTGVVTKSHLDELFKLVRDGNVAPSRANILSYGRVTEGIDAAHMMDFCFSLAELNDGAIWYALHIIYMYCYGNKGSVEILKEQLKKFLASVPLDETQHRTSTDAHQWKDLVQKLLKEHDEQFSIALLNKIIEESKKGIGFSTMSHYVKPILFELMRDYGDILWPIFGDAVVNSERLERYHLQSLLNSIDRFSKENPSVLSVLSVGSVMLWCGQRPDIGPVFVSDCVNIFDMVSDKLEPSALFLELLIQYGDNERVASALGANMGTRSWSGSLVPYLEADKEALLPLLEHDNRNVRSWVKERVSLIDRQILYESKRDEEEKMGRY
ncbi:MAG: alpha/beta hydrolase [Desulforhopalus sp.]|nr:alpha/beta hydrolase [Desulforhopalus sp.]